MPVDQSTFRAVGGRFATGVVVVTALDDGAPVGFTAQTFTPLSMDPPLVSVCPQKTSTTWPRIRSAGGFCVNVLSVDQRDVCGRFASSGGDKFAGLEWQASPVNGFPLFPGVLGWWDCRIEGEHDAGDHTIAVARVLDLGEGADAAPLLFFRAGFGRFEA